MKSSFYIWDFLKADIFPISILEFCFQFPNIRVPLYIDVAKTPDFWALPKDYGPHSIDLLLNINMIHISSNLAVTGLFEAASGLLKKGTGLLITYGPYAFEGKISPDSNIQFDDGLRKQNPEWGLRDVRELKEVISCLNSIYEK